MKIISKTILTLKVLDAVYYSKQNNMIKETLPVKKLRKTLSVILTISILLTTMVWPTASAQPEPFDEAAMVDEAVSIGIWESIMDAIGLFFE